VAAGGYARRRRDVADPFRVAADAFRATLTVAAVTLFAFIARSHAATSCARCPAHDTAV